MITKELIENFRETVKPFVSQILFGTNYEGMGTLDCVEFERDFDEILDLALAGLKYKAQLFSEGTTSDFPEPTRIISETRAIPSDDDRVSLSERVTATFYDDEYEEWSQKTVTVRDVLDAVCDEYTVLPSAQPEPQEGHWIKHESPDGGEQYECSRCGVLWEFNDGTPEDNEAYYCPNCGTKMKGERQK